MIISIEYLNTKKIYHRDLKPANFLICNDFDKTYLHLNDFGIAKDFNDKNHMETTVSSLKGTPAYTAPEYLGRDTE